MQIKICSLSPDMREKVLSHVKKAYNFIDLDIAVLPVVACSYEDELSIFINDEYASFILEFADSLFRLEKRRGENASKRLDNLSKKFREDSTKYMLSTHATFDIRD